MRKIEVTEHMTRIGAAVLSEMDGEASKQAQAEAVFLAMAAASANARLPFSDRMAAAGLVDVVGNSIVEVKEPKAKRRPVSPETREGMKMTSRRRRCAAFLTR